MFTRLINGMEQLNVWIGKAVSYLLLVIMSITLLEVIMRYGFNRPTIWVHETSQQLFAISFLLGAAYTLAQDGHVRVDILTRRLSDKGMAVLEIINAVFFFLFSGLLLYLGWDMAYESATALERTQTPWEPYIFHVIAMIPLAALLLISQGIVSLFKNIKLLFGGA